jgi:hypothetical protein
MKIGWVNFHWLSVRLFLIRITWFSVSAYLNMLAFLPVYVLLSHRHCNNTLHGSRKSQFGKWSRLGWGTGLYYLWYSDWLRAGRPKGSEFESRYGQEFSLLHVVQTGSGVHPNSCLSPGVKRPKREADHSPPASAYIKKIWIYTSTPP